VQHSSSSAGPTQCGALLSLAGSLCALSSPIAYGRTAALIALALGLAAAAAALLLRSRMRRKFQRGNFAFAGLLMLCVTFVSFSGAAWRVVAWRATRWPETLVERRLVEARVVSIPAHAGDALRFTALVREPRDPSAPVRRVQVDWPTPPATLAVHPGERWQLLLELRAARGRLNPGAADVERQYLRDGVHALGRVRESPLDRRLGTQWCLDRWREQLGAHIRAAVDERDSAALLVALAVGDTQFVSNEQWRIFNANGITHLVAISGLHVTLFCLLMARLARALWRLWPWLQATLARDSFAWLLGWLASAGYALLAGWSVPTQRTLIMLAAWHGARLLLRPPAAAPSLALALLAVLWLDPAAPLSAGFWLSFGAVAVLMMGGPAAERRGWWQALGELWRTQWRVVTALLPASLALFGSCSLVSLLVNLVAIPFFSFVLVPLVLAGSVLDLCPNGAGEAVLQLAAWVARAAWPAFAWLADLPLAQWRFSPPVWWYVPAALALPIVLLPWPRVLRLSAALVLLPLIAPAGERIAPGSYRLTLLDVGRGAAQVVRTATHTLVYDDGEVYGSAGRVSASTVLAVLRQQRRSRIDLLLLPALDADRMAGVNALSSGVTIRQIVSAVAAARLPPEMRSCQSQPPWIWDGVRFAWLASAGHCLLRVGPAGRGLLIAAEADLPALNAAVGQGLVPARVVVAPRGGAAGAYSPAWAAALRTDWLLVSQSLDGLQSATVGRTLAAWRALGARVLASGAVGAVDVAFDGRGLRVETRRHPRFNPIWRWPAGPD